MRITALLTFCVLIAGCASPGTAPNPLSRDLRASLKLTDIKISAVANAVTDSDKPAFDSMAQKLSANLKTGLPGSFGGNRPIAVDVSINRFSINQRLLSSTPTTLALVSIVDSTNGAILARYHATHEEPIGVAVSAVMGTDAFVAQQLAGTIKAHIESDTTRTDRAVPHVAGGLAGELL